MRVRRKRGKDYTSAPNTFTFSANETEQTLDITVIDDKLQEGDENVVVTLTDLAEAKLGSDYPYDAHTLTINDDDDVLDMPVLSIDNVMATEDTTAIFRVTLSAVSDDVVSVDYNTQAVTATAGSDYTEVIDKTLTIAPGQISGTIAVDVLINEPSDEGPETATVTLSNSVGAVIDASAYVGTLTILEG